GNRPKAQHRVTVCDVDTGAPLVHARPSPVRATYIEETTDGKGGVINAAIRPVKWRRAPHPAPLCHFLQ
ncbi:MAG TPA: hypothetical protein VE549_07845, partial [Myxococcaceae bacterium]|nr:hypothetical protein [Myxococcaceae bacterium]